MTRGDRLGRASLAFGVGSVAVPGLIVLNNSDLTASVFLALFVVVPTAAVLAIVYGVRVINLPKSESSRSSRWFGGVGILLGSILFLLVAALFVLGLMYASSNQG
jgi:hypothetical protein